MLPFDIENIHAFARDWGYIGVCAMVALESMGVPVPSEIALAGVAVYAGTTHNLNIELVILAAFAGAFFGGIGGYWIGRRYGFPLLKRYGKLIRLDEGRLKIAQYLFMNHGGKVVFLGRFVPFLRTFSSILAGANGMDWRHFLIVNSIGGLIWSTVLSLLGYTLGRSGDVIIDQFGLISLTAAIILLGAAFIFLHRHERVLRQKAETALPGPLGLPSKTAAPFASGAI